MKKNAFLVITLFAAASMAYAGDIITLDLTKTTTPLAFNAETGAWDKTYDEDIESLESQCFSFAHHAMAEWRTWWDFTASNSADNSPRADYITYQFSNMAKGGIVLNEDGTVKTDQYGSPVVSAEVPYIVGYYDFYFSKRPCDLTFNDGKAHEAVGVYVNLDSWVYYTLRDGEGMGRAFNNGDSLTITVHGVAPDQTEKTVETKLASYENGNLTINRGWRYIDLSPLGEVNELYFVVNSTDQGEYGCNTPGFFCLDKLMVKEADPSTTAQIERASEGITYDRASKTVSVDSQIGYAAVYDLLGNRVLASDESQFSISSLTPGVYMVRAGASSLKIVR